MPAKQRGSVVRRGSQWAARWYDERGDRKFQGGFQTRTAAREYVDRQVGEVAAVRRGDRPTVGQIPTVVELVTHFLASHDVDPATISKLGYELKHATTAFGERRVDELRAYELDAWRGTLPPRTRHQLFRSFRQVLEQAVTWQLLETNPASRIRNRRVVLDEDREIRPFDSWEDVEAIAAELAPLYRALPEFLVGTGMRPEEALALEWRDIDHANAVVSVDRVHSQGRTSRVRSPTGSGAVCRFGRACSRCSTRFRAGSTPLVFPANDGEHIKLATFRLRHWTPALRAAGVNHRSVYTCRHTFAAWSIAAGVQLFYLSGSWVRASERM